MSYRQAFYVGLLRPASYEDRNTGAMCMVGPFETGDVAAKYIAKCEKYAKDNYKLGPDDVICVVGLYVPVLPVAMFNDKLWIPKSEVMS